MHVYILREVHGRMTQYCMKTLGLFLVVLLIIMGNASYQLHLLHKMNSGKNDKHVTKFVPAIQKVLTDTDVAKSVL